MTLMNYGKSIGHSLRKMMETDPSFRTVAYFSMEIGLRPELPTYSGGLGILAGDILKGAADLGVPMAGITLLYRKGYFRQTIDEEGWQHESPEEWKPEQALHLLPNEVSVQISSRTVKIRAWMTELVGASGFPAPVYFLDTDFEENHPDDRPLTAVLYGGDQRYRLAQEVILGIGGLRMLRDLGYRRLETFHLNEGHAGFLTLELLREQGYEDLEKIRNQVVFTTHTPVSAGHDHFSMELVREVLSPVFADQLQKMMGSGGVSMTDLGFRLSRFVNGVSRKHAQVSREIFHNPGIESITNGVHSRTWTCSGFRKLFDQAIPGWDADPSRLIQALFLPDEEVWKTHQAAKMRLLARVLEETGIELDPDLLTFGFGRRAAAYKRADLIFQDMEKLTNICSGRAQFVFSGKAHPRDEEGKRVLQRVIRAARKLAPALKVVFLPNYNMEIASLMTSGVDVWLNTPVRPREASGTSGMKCAHNGVLNFSVLDGWWIEGCLEDVTGWSIGPIPLPGTEDDRSEEDVRDFYSKLERRVIPTFEKDRSRWVWMMKNAIALNASVFNTHRLVREYCQKAYGIAFRGL